MTLSAGTRLGPYEILSPLGAGGMGEVYRAKDTRLARAVAIKVLPEALASDAERLRRFEKEAKSASALNHQNIVTIYDVGSESGVSYIAMELVDGVTLRESLAAGPLPIKRLLQIAPQIAEGLARAHEVGIVHRDLKPENVMVKKDGLVKILDFGLAKLTSTGSGSDEASQLPTMTGTQPGVVVGTVSYMSPEQASGQPLDFRSDQFSLGSMLYEMATGRRAFQKKTAVDTLAAILNEEPQSIAIGSPLTPAPLRWIVDRCLAKEAQGRYVSTDDLARDLVGIRDHLSEMTSGVTPSVAGRPRRQSSLLAGAAGILLLLAAIAAGWWLRDRETVTAVPRFRRLTFRRGNLLSARFAPDGRTVVYAASWDGAPAEIFTVRTDSIESRPVGLSMADIVGVSAKGELAVLLKTGGLLNPEGTGTLARLPLGGGTPREVLERVGRADWSPDGKDLAASRILPNGDVQIEYPMGHVIATSADFGGDLRVSPNGELLAVGEGDKILTLDRKGKREVLAEGWGADALAWSPRGDEIIFAGTRLGNDMAIRAVSLSGRVRVLISNGLDLILHDAAPDGRLLIERASADATIGFRAAGENRERDLGWFDRPAVRGLSADGKVITFYRDPTAGERESGIYLRRTDGAPPVRLGEGDVQDLSADGAWALAIQKRPSPSLLMLPAGPGSSRTIPVEGVEPQQAWLLPGGRGFLIRGADKGGESTLVTVAPEGGKPTPVRTDQWVKGSRVVVSPEASRLAYMSRDGKIRIAPLSGGNVEIVPNAHFGADYEPIQWSADGLFLYVWFGRRIPGQIERLEIATGKHQLWKELSPENSTGVIGIGNPFLTRDGQFCAYNYLRVLASDLFVVEGVK